ncbi:hypothetical protein E4U44_006734, partial [Claviceps purpurea]
IVESPEDPAIPLKPPPATPRTATHDPCPPVAQKSDDDVLHAFRGDFHPTVKSTSRENRPSSPRR